jgi:hypothetical protein
MHLKSLERFPFDSVLVPYNFSMMSQPDYAADFDALVRVCRDRRVAIQTIKSVARRRWQEGDGPRYSWYEPLRDPDAIWRAVQYAFAQPEFFLNTSSDATLLNITLESAAGHRGPVAIEALQEDARRHRIEPLFVRGVSDVI